MTGTTPKIAISLSQLQKTVLIFFLSAANFVNVKHNSQILENSLALTKIKEV